MALRSSAVIKTSSYIPSLSHTRQRGMTVSFNANLGEGEPIFALAGADVITALLRQLTGAPP